MHVEERKKFQIFFVKHRRDVVYNPGRRVESTDEEHSKLGAGTSNNVLAKLKQRQRPNGKKRCETNRRTVDS